MEKKESKLQIKKLIEKYQRVKEVGKINSYNEAQTRNEFIEPLFECLGWDMRNYSFENEVTTEESVSGGRIDLAFRINGIPKFFLEAKSMKSDLSVTAYATQAINYSWNKGVDFAVLTDFESIKVFYAQTESKNLLDKLIFEIPVTEYLEDFERLWLLSKPAFSEGLLGKYAEQHAKMLKKLTVNDHLFNDLKRIRELLTKSFSIWNKNVDRVTLEEGVQRIIDRLVFIRVLEDKKLEPSILRPLVREWLNSGRKRQLFSLLIEKFRELDEIYNSNLFSKHACEDWEEYDDAIKDSIAILYGHDLFEYDFKQIPLDILGGVYESYLGYVSQNPVEEDNKSNWREKRKSQGIYYTPKYIVDYIVQNTLGEVLKTTKSIAELNRIKVLDPACGSGPFLTEALEMINDKYKDFGRAGDQYTKSEICLSNIYGVDLDPQAVELAKLNLLIDILDTKGKLPDLTANIRNGNSLIEDDKIAGSLAFKWHEEFPDIMKSKGFDIIIGNPPYIKEYTNKLAFDGLHSDPYYQGKMDIWTLFACRAIDLLKDGGYFSFIAPNNWLTNAGASIFRNKILSEGQIIEFVDFGDFKVFEDAGIQTMIFVFRKGTPKKIYQTTYAKITDKNIREEVVSLLLQSNLKTANEGISKFDMATDPKKLVGKNIVFSNQTSGDILTKIESKKNFELTEKEVAQGIVAAPDKYFIVHDLSEFNSAERNFIKPFYTSTAKYTCFQPTSHIFYLSNKNFSGKNIDDYPNIKKHFDRFKKILKEAKIKYGTPSKPYFYLHREREEKFFQRGAKIVGQARTAFPKFLFTGDEYYGSRAMNFIKTDRINLKFLTGLLNSRLVYFWLKNKGKQLGDLLQIDSGPLLNIPLVKPDEKIQNESALLMDKVSVVYRELHSIPENSDKWRSHKNEIKKLEGAIDQIIYKLYDLTPEEIKIIEGIN